MARRGRKTAEETMIANIKSLEDEIMKSKENCAKKEAELKGLKAELIIECMDRYSVGIEELLSFMRSKNDNNAYGE